MKKTIIMAVMLISLCGNSLFAKEATNKSIDKLIKITNATKMVDMFSTRLIERFKHLDSKVPDEFWNDLKKEFIDKNKFTEIITPIYKKYLSEEDIQNLIKFYKSEVGQKLIKVQPKIINESMIAGSKWGKEAAQNILKKYKEKYGNITK